MIGGIGRLGEKAIELVNRPKPQINYVTISDYNDYGDNRPNLIEIVDDTVNADIGKDVIGFLNAYGGEQILFLFDSAIEASGLVFRPTVGCNAIYCVHPLDRRCYVNVCDVVAETNKEKIAELQEVARCIGAKRCVVEIVETNGENTSSYIGQDASIEVTGEDVNTFMQAIGKPLPPTAKKAIKDKKGEGKLSVFRKKDDGSTAACYAKSEVCFEGGSFVKEPVLRWFKGDSVIEGIIESRRGETQNKMQSGTVKLNSSSVRIINRKTAMALDVAISESKGKLESGIQNKIEKGQNTAFLYTLEF